MDRKAVLVSAVAACLALNVLDVISTRLCLDHVAGARESNRLMLDVLTGEYVLGYDLIVKGVYIACRPLLISAAIFAGTRSWLWASLPWWIYAWARTFAVASNFSLLAIRGAF